MQGRLPRSIYTHSSNSKDLIFDDTSIKAHLLQESWSICWNVDIFFVWGSSTYMTIYDNTPRWIMQDCKTPSNWAYLLRLLVIFKFLQLTQLLCRVRYLRVKHMFSRWNCWPLGAPWRPRPDGWRLPKPYRQPHPRWVSRSSQWDALHTWDPLGHCRRRRAWSTPQFSHVRGAYRQLPPGKWVVHLCWAEFMKYEVSQQQDLSISESTMLTSRMTNEASVTVQLPVTPQKIWSYPLQRAAKHLWACSISREGVANATKDFNLVQIFFWKHPTQQKCLTSLSRRSTCWHLERPKKKLLLGGDVAVRKQLPFHMSAFSTCPPSGIQATFTRLSFLGWRVDLILSKSLESMC